MADLRDDHGDYYPGGKVVSVAGTSGTSSGTTDVSGKVTRVNLGTVASDATTNELAAKVNAIVNALKPAVAGCVALLIGAFCMDAEAQAALKAAHGDIRGGVSVVTNVEEYVTGATNALAAKIAASVEGCATETWVTNKGYVTASVTNGLLSAAVMDDYATHAWVTNKEYVTKAVTNGLLSAAVMGEYATRIWVTNKEYVTEGVTNGLASAAYVDGKGYATETWVTNKQYVTKSVTNGLAARAYVDGNPWGYLTAGDVEGNPWGYLTAGDVEGYALMTWVLERIGDAQAGSNVQVTAVWNEGRTQYLDADGRKNLVEWVNGSNRVITVVTNWSGATAQIVMTTNYVAATTANVTNFSEAVYNGDSQVEIGADNGGEIIFQNTAQGNLMLGYDDDANGYWGPFFLIDSTSGWYLDRSELGFTDSEWRAIATRDWVNVAITGKVTAAYLSGLGITGGTDGAAVTNIVTGMAGETNFVGKTLMHSSVDNASFSTYGGWNDGMGDYEYKTWFGTGKWGSIVNFGGDGFEVDIERGTLTWTKGGVGNGVMRFPELSGIGRSSYDDYLVLAGDVPSIVTNTVTNVVTDAYVTNIILAKAEDTVDFGLPKTITYEDNIDYVYAVRYTNGEWEVESSGQYYDASASSVVQYDREWRGSEGGKLTDKNATNLTFKLNGMWTQFTLNGAVVKGKNKWGLVTTNDLANISIDLGSVSNVVIGMAGETNWNGKALATTNALAAYLPLTGGTMTGKIYVPSLDYIQVGGTNETVKSYVDNKASLYMPLDGGEFGGNILFTRGGYDRLRIGVFNWEYGIQISGGDNGDATFRFPTTNGTFALQSDITAATTGQTATNLVRSIAGTIYDEPLVVLWEQRMVNGNLYYIAVTNVNLNAE